MKTSLRDAREPAAPIVQLAEVADGADAANATSALPSGAEADLAPLERARAFAEPLLTGRLLDTGEDAAGHAEGVAAILQGIGAAPSMRAAAYLVYAGDLPSPR